MKAVHWFGRAICLMVFSLFASFGSNASSTPSDWPSVLASVRSDFSEGLCENVWSKVWPHAAAENRDALRLLALSIRFYGLTIPGELPDQTSADRHFKTLAVHAISDHNAEGFVAIIRALVRERFRSYSESVAPSCFGSGELSTQCRLELLNADYVPELVDYIPYVERLLSSGEYKSECKLRER